MPKALVEYKIRKTVDHESSAKATCDIQNYTSIKDIFTYSRPFDHIIGYN